MVLKIVLLLVLHLCDDLVCESSPRDIFPSLACPILVVLLAHWQYGIQMEKINTLLIFTPESAQPSNSL